MVPESTTLGEFNLFRSNEIKHVYNQISGASFGLNFNQEDEALFFKKYGEMWIEVLCEKYNLPKDKVIFIKSPILSNVELWLKAFPNAKILIVTRDGRDNVISSVKTSNDFRSWHSFWLKFKKRANYFSGRSFINHTKDWRDTARQVFRLSPHNNLKVMKYEELNNSKKGVEDMLRFYGLKINENILERCLKAPVVGSSVGVNSNGIRKPNWKPDQEKSKFVFSNKWVFWGMGKRMVFKMLAGKELKELGYETDNKW
ncbi:hypothetical protein GCM10011364_19750 [Mangrovimonas yunxiaonensis]|nr:hypothetical protein GCM10011364_19750 [Mangrovimonas yunxiaonensis]